MPKGATRLACCGTLVVVVGPSGAGKDTLIAKVLEQLSGRGDVHVVQRVITRTENAGGENHRAVAAEEFETMRQAGAFAVDWDAHGLSYGILSCVHEKLALGHLIIANGSRSALPRFASAFDPMLVVNVIARPEVLVQRLQERGRESREEILQRLKRSSLEVQGPFKVVTIDNSGDLATSVEQLTGTLTPLLRRP